MKLFVLHESIDLGSHVVGVFSTQEKYDKAVDMYIKWYCNRHDGMTPNLFQEEYEVDLLDLGFGEKKETFKL